MFHTRPDFEATLLKAPFDDATMAEIKRVAVSMQPSELELHEAKLMGRFVVRNHAYYKKLQRELEPLISSVAGEEVESSYNFLSMYTSMGVLPMHMDAPNAKWTFDLCIDQNERWPIHFSAVQPWPDTDAAQEWSADRWEEEIMASLGMGFRSVELEPGQAVVFSGSSQWHYRDALPRGAGRSYCTLLFFHFIPKGTAELVAPSNWARLFAVPELE